MMNDQQYVFLNSAELKFSSKIPIFFVSNVYSTDFVTIINPVYDYELQLHNYGRSFCFCDLFIVSMVKFIFFQVTKVICSLGSL